jgi:prohibitin 2
VNRIFSLFVDERGRMRLLHLIGLLVLLVLLVVLWPFSTVPTGFRGVVTQFGRIVGVQDEGLAVLPPWQKLHIFNTRAETTHVKKAEGGTQDQQPVDVALTVRYAIQPNKVAEVFEQYSRDGDLSSYVETATQEVFKAVTARYTAPDLILKRPAVSNDVFNMLNAKLNTYGAKVLNIDMTNFAFAPEYMKAISQKVTQDQLRQAEENKQRTVEAQERQKVIVAEAAANVTRVAADAEAYSALKVATAQAEALRVQNAALAQSKDVLELRRIEVEGVKAGRWNGALPTTMYGSAPIPFLNATK